MGLTTFCVLFPSNQFLHCLTHVAWSVLSFWRCENLQSALIIPLVLMLINPHRCGAFAYQYWYLLCPVSERKWPKAPYLLSPVSFPFYNSAAGTWPNYIKPGGEAELWSRHVASVWACCFKHLSRVNCLVVTADWAIVCLFHLFGLQSYLSASPHLSDRTLHCRALSACLITWQISTAVLTVAVAFQSAQVTGLASSGQPAYLVIITM